MIYLHYPTTTHPRKRCILLMLDEDKKTFSVENLTEFSAKSKKDNAVMMSWLMTTRAANAVERYVKEALHDFCLEDNKYIHDCSSILEVWKLGEGKRYPFLEWV